jgi:membrane-associated phospholipid phosphatase
VRVATDVTTGRVRWRVLASWAAALSAVALVLLTYGIYRVGRVLRIDTRTVEIVDNIRRHWLVVVLQNITWAGDFLFASVFLLVVSLVVAWRRGSAGTLWLGVCAVALLVATVGTGKQVIDRSRIPFAVGSFGDGGTSYPSGHATTAVVVGGTLVLIASPVLTTHALRWAWAAMVAYSGVVGASRIYLRYHWFTDVLAGWLLGTVIVCVLALVFVRSLGSSPPHGRDARNIPEPNAAGPGGRSSE